VKLQQKAEELSKEIFLGGRVDFFEPVGRLQLILLLKEGLYPDSKVLDIGCGCLRGGYWLIHFLDPDCYFGIEPNREMLEAGIEYFLEPGLLEMKRPKFDSNPNFASSVFGEKFDFFMARSIWTHASKAHIQTMLDGFLRDSRDNGVFLTSYKRASLFRRDYKVERWVGRSHESDIPGSVHHSLRWIQNECQQRGLVAVEIRERAYNYGSQVWLKIAKKQ
jgi:hypothetical protein